jgi:GntR family transcriptional regulator
MTANRLRQLPLTAQARLAIEHMIQSRNLKVGDRLPTEQELAETTGIARTTVREAYKLLEQAGLVTVVHGRGRFLTEIASLVQGRPVTVFESVTEMMGRLGYEVTNTIVSVQRRAASAEERRSLRIVEGIEVVDISRLRWHDDELFIYSHNVIRADTLGEREPSEIDWRGSLVAFMAEVGQEPVASLASLQGAMLPSGIPGVDQQWSALPWLLVVETAVNAEGTPVLYAQDYHRGDVFSFHALRMRPDPTTVEVSTGLGMRYLPRSGDAPSEEEHAAR